MRLLLNVLWFVFGGFISGSLWILAGCVLAITIVGLPWTPAAFRLAGFSYWPFGRMLIDRDDGMGSCLLNGLWLVLAPDGGWRCTTWSWPCRWRSASSASRSPGST